MNLFRYVILGWALMILPLGYLGDLKAMEKKALDVVDDEDQRLAYEEALANLNRDINKGVSPASFKGLQKEIFDESFKGDPNDEDLLLSFQERLLNLKRDISKVSTGEHSVDVFKSKVEAKAKAKADEEESEEMGFDLFNN